MLGFGTEQFEAQVFVSISEGRELLLKDACQDEHPSGFQSFDDAFFLGQEQLVHEVCTGHVAANAGVAKGGQVSAG